MNGKNLSASSSSSTSMRALSPVELEGHKVGIKLADEAALGEAGTKGATPQSIEKVWQSSYTLGRNAIEGALGAEEPYGEDRLKDEK